jgi:hypothetical protein
MSPDCMTEGSQHEENRTDNKQNDPDREQNPYARNEPDDEKDNAEDYHLFSGNVK